MKTNLLYNLVKRKFTFINQKMDFLDINSGSSSQFLRSTFARSMSMAQDFISLMKLTEECNKLSVQIIQMPDKRFQSGLNLVALKAKKNNSKLIVIIFITKYKQQEIVASAYFEDKKIQKVQIKSETQLPKLILKWLDSCKSNLEDTSGNSIKIIQKLNTKCTQLSKSQKNLDFAIQKLKTTRQYRSLIQNQIQISVQIQSLAQTLLDNQKKVQSQSDQLLKKVLDIQKIKNQIQELQYEYEEVCKYLKNVRQHLNSFIEIQKNKIENMQITSEAQLNDFIAEAKKYKKLQLQKKLLL